MKFLNLDLDFFVSGIVHNPPSRMRRVSKRQYKPWPELKVREFLEQQCGLNRRSRIPGRFGVHHDAVFGFWRCLLKTAPSGTQLDITHVDAHADFATLCDKGLLFIQQSLLHYPPDQRLYVIDHEPHQVTLANYMSFAVACRWVARIEFVTHPHWQQDIFDVFFRNKNPETEFIELHAKPKNPATVEPSVPITFTPESKFAQKEFVQAFLCKSPNYTPQTADCLIPIFENYIDFNAG